MTEEDKVLQFHQNGSAVLKNPAFQLAMTSIRSKYIEEFKNTPMFGGEKHREKMHVALNLFDELEMELEKMLQDGRALLEMEKRKNRVVRGEFTNQT